jgi:hypothetical protein
MSDEEPNSAPAEQTTYNVAFLLRNYPPEMHVQGPDFFMGKVDELFLKPLRDLATKHQEIGLFVGTVPADQFVWVGVWVTADSRLNAIAEARHRVEGFVDACSVTIDSGITPCICDVVFVGTRAIRR